MEATGGRANLKVDRVRARTATATQWLRRRAAGHTPSKLHRGGACGAETGQWLRWVAGTKVGHTGRLQTFKVHRPASRVAKTNQWSRRGGHTQRAANQRSCAPSPLLVLVVFEATVLRSAVGLRDVGALVLRNGASLAAVAPMPANMQVGKTMSDLNCLAGGFSAETQGCGHSRGNPSVAVISSCCI